MSGANIILKKSILVAFVLFIAASLPIAAQQKDKASEKWQEKTEILSEEQKNTVKEILSDFNSSAFTEEDAKEIHEAFREAGLRGGPALDEAIKEAGFDPEKLRDLAPPPERNNKQATSVATKVHTKNSYAQNSNGFVVKSSGVMADGSLMIDYTGDGRGVSFPVEWMNSPEGTKYFALSLWHYPHPSDPSEVKSYWVLYNIPADVHSLPENVQGIGEKGYNDKDKTAYDPMKSKGPGVKEYNLTVYALSAKPEFTTTKVYRADLLKAIEGITLGESTLTYTYERGSRRASEQ